jgi:hypothetical protein
MEPKFQSSFIPKAPIVSSSTAAPISRPRTTNIFAIAATIIFLITLAVSGAELIYKNILTNQVAEADQALNRARSEFQPEKIKELVGANDKIILSKKLLDKHIVVSEVLALLEALTIKKMRFENFSYEEKAGESTIIMDGVAQNYNALAEQEHAFLDSKFIKNPDFSNFTLDDNGNVKVKFFAELDPTLVLYKQALGIQNTPPSLPPTPQATTTATTTPFDTN